MEASDNSSFHNAQLWKNYYSGPLVSTRIFSRTHYEFKIPLIMKSMRSPTQHHNYLPESCTQFSRGHVWPLGLLRNIPDVSGRHLQFASMNWKCLPIISYWQTRMPSQWIRRVHCTVCHLEHHALLHYNAFNHVYHQHSANILLFCGHWPFLFSLPVLIFSSWKMVHFLSPHQVSLLSQMYFLFLSAYRHASPAATVLFHYVLLVLSWERH